MNFLDQLTVYATPWTVTSSQPLSASDLSKIDHAVVTPSEYGLSVCFFLKSGGHSYIPLSNTSSLTAGETVNFKEAKILTLSKPGERDTRRVEI